MTDTPLADIVAAALEQWNAGNLPGYLEMYDESIQLHGYGPAPMSKAEVTGMYGGMFQVIEGIHLTIEDSFELGDKVVLRARLTGTHTGPLFGVEATGNPIDQGVITILRFADGKCVERWSVADTLSVLYQIGATSLP